MKIHFKSSSSAFIAYYSAGWWLLVLSFVSPLVESGPLNIDGPSREVANNSLTDFDLPAVSKGCRYKALFYSNGEQVSTDEPCLACHCKGTVVVCKLRICPEIPVPPPPGCIVVHKAKSCCSQLICQADNNKKISREQRFPINVSNETLLASVSNETKESAGYCVLDGTVYAEGSAMRSSTLCQYCFCIRGEMKCSSPQCVIPLNGCKPKFRSYACCPTNYDCGQSNETAVLKTVPSSTQVPQFLKGCLVNNQFVPEGEPVLPVQLTGFGNSSSGGGGGGSNSVCQTCFCMGGVVHCRPLECDHPIDGCEPIKEDGHCCPDRYDCSKPKQSSQSPKMTGTTKGMLLMTSSTGSGGYPTTTELVGFNEEAEDEVYGGTTETIGSSGYSSPSDYYVPVAITTMRGTMYEEDGESTTAPTMSHHSSSSNEDSFERIAAIVSGGSSEESTSILPPTTLIGGRGNDEKDQPKKKTRVSATTVGGFKNRSDLGSREERRSKDGDELSVSAKQLQQQSTEDDERDEYYNFPVFETTMSNAIENLGGATTELTEGDINAEIIPEESTSIPETESAALIVGLETDSEHGDDPVPPVDNVTENNYISEQDLQETTIVPRALADELITTVMMDDNLVETTEKSGEQTVIPSVTPLSSSSSPMSTAAADISSTSPHPESTPIPTSSTSGSLEFIPFVEEDALVPLDNNNETVDTNAAGSSNGNANSHETDNFDKLTRVFTSLFRSNASLLKPLELKFFNGTTEESLMAQGSTEIADDALPILVEKDENSPPTDFNLGNNNDDIAGEISIPPGSSSLYNNGYYPHGSIIKDDEGPADELHVSEGEVDTASKMATGTSTTEETDFVDNLSSTPVTMTTKQPEQPLKAISSIDKFIPSYAPATVQTTDESLDNNPSRTYSKFGIQDAPLYRYDHQGSPLDNPGFPYNNNNNKPPTTGIYHHRYYNEPEEIPTSRIQNPYNYYSTNTNNNKPGHGGGGGGGQQGIMGMIPQLYKNNQFFYEDSSAALDSYEDYEAYVPPSSDSNSIASTPSSAVTPRFSSTSTPQSTGTISTNFQFLGERVRMPSYNQQRATSTPKYKYAYVNSNNSNRGSTTNSFKNKFTTERTVATAAAASLANDYKPFQAPFPFSLPRSQDDNNLLKSLGIKLSGCNVVGKMYSVGEIIEELSSECLRCMCSDIGVHCAERKC